MRYLLGLGIGCGIVFFMFPNYNWLGWTPNNTLMKQVRESEFRISDRGQCYLSCTMTNMEQVKLMRNNGTIDLSKSDTRANPKKYRVTYGEVGMDVLVSDSVVTLDGIESTLSRTCICR